MKRTLLTGLIILVFLGFLELHPEESRGKKTTLDELIQIALQQNLQIRAAKKEWEASLQKIPQAKALPDPVLSYAHFGQSIETRLGPQRNKISVSQQIPFFGKLGLKGEIAAQSSDVLEQQYHTVKADMVLKVKEAYFSLFLIDRSIRISQEEKGVYRRLSEIAAKKYETGQVGQQDALKAQLEISKVTEKLLNYHRVRKAIVAELNSLMNRETDSLLEETEEFAMPERQIDLEQLISWARENRPELRKAQSVIQKNRESLNLVKKDYYPDFRIMLDYIDIGAGTSDHPDDGRNAWMASIGINIPLWRKKLRAAEAEAIIRIKASEDLYENIENETLSRIHALYFEIETAREQIELYEFSLLPQAEQTLKASEIGYLTGKVDFLNLLDSERMILTIRNGYFKVLAELGRSLVRLERLVGQELYKMNDSSGEEVME
ncbi:MAG: TolC family protein [Candidatus Aminicenantes bacterium]|nr:MAG: TolC family protein [Candidatus Aminicenantes bacterium]